MLSPRPATAHGGSGQSAYYQGQRMPKLWDDDAIARFIGLTYAERQQHKLYTIGSINVGKQARKELRKRQNRLTQERKRRRRGVQPRAAYEATALETLAPWDL